MQLSSNTCIHIPNAYYGWLIKDRENSLAWPWVVSLQRCKNIFLNVKTLYLVRIEKKLIWNFKWSLTPHTQPSPPPVPKCRVKNPFTNNVQTVELFGCLRVFLRSHSWKPALHKKYRFDEIAPRFPVGFLLYKWIPKKKKLIVFYLRWNKLRTTNECWVTNYYEIKA